MTLIRRLDHVAVAVSDTDTALEYFCGRLGLKVAHSEVNEAVGVRLTYLDVGNVWLQLVEPLHDEMPVAEHLRLHGEGIHHICLAVENVERDARTLSAGAEVRIGSGRSRPSAFLAGEPLHGTRIECTRFDLEADVCQRDGWLKPSTGSST